MQFNLESTCTSEFFKKLKWHEPRRQVQFQLFSNFSFLKNSLQIEEKTYDYFLFEHKEIHVKERPFLTPVFLIRENLFQSFRTKFSSLFYVISIV